jgi:hypothetical protein
MKLQGKGQLPAIYRALRPNTEHVLDSWQHTHAPRTHIASIHYTDPCCTVAHSVATRADSEFNGKKTHPSVTAFSLRPNWMLNDVSSAHTVYRMAAGREVWMTRCKWQGWRRRSFQGTVIAQLRLKQTIKRPVTRTCLRMMLEFPAFAQHQKSAVGVSARTCWWRQISTKPSSVVQRSRSWARIRKLSSSNPVQNTGYSYPNGATAHSGSGPSHYRGYTITATPHSVGLLWTSDQLVAETATFDSTKHYPWPGRIRTRNPTKRAASDEGLRPRGHRDRQDIGRMAYVSATSSIALHPHAVR